jgi:hypothetical protein
LCHRIASSSPFVSRQREIAALIDSSPDYRKITVGVFQFISKGVFYFFIPCLASSSLGL